MTELILMGDGAKLPAHLKQYAAEAEKASSLVTGFNSIPKISIRGKQFRLDKPDGKEAVYPMGQGIDVVILESDPPKGTAKSYYSDPWTSGTEDLPACFSSNGVTPDGFVTEPQSKSCASCEFNAFGSGIDQKGNPTKGKRCGDHKNLFLVEASQLEGTLYSIRVPATSLKALSTYGRHLAGHSVAPSVLVTHLTFTDAEHPQLEFSPSRYLDEIEAPIAVARSKSEEVRFAMPSLNIMSASADQKALPAPPAEGTDSELPPPPTKVKTMTAKAGKLTLQSFLDKGWTEEQLINNGYMELVQ